MSPECEKALEQLKREQCTCVIRKGSTAYTSKLRGVRPLLDLLDARTDCRDFAAADKVVGKAAAFLYILLGVRELYALVISTPALELLQRHGIAVTFDQCVPAIRNRDNTGFCPMESSVKGIDDPEAALFAIREKLKQLSNGGDSTGK